jgi:hypothetical protein
LRANTLLRRPDEHRLSARREISHGYQQNNSALRRLFQFGQLGAFFRAFPTRFTATGKSLDLRMLAAGLRQLLTGTRTDFAQRVSIL